MRALQYDAYGPVERLSLRDAPSPRPAAGPLVRVTVAALNPKDESQKSESASGYASD